jgi:hypothetical protein
MPTYQTARLQEYEPRFLEVAEDIFERVSREVPDRQLERHEGSFSVYAHSSKATAAKIVLWHPDLGKNSDMPRMRDGVYVWVRANGSIGDEIWGGILPNEMPRMFQRMWRDAAFHVSPNTHADFAYFPVMAGDNLDDIADLLIACSHV